MVVGRIQTCLTLSMDAMLGCAAVLLGLLEKECCASQSASYSLACGTPCRNQVPKQAFQEKKFKCGALLGMHSPIRAVHSVGLCCVSIWDYYSPSTSSTVPPHTLKRRAAMCLSFLFFL